ncbi:MAG: M48 family metalloprotease [Myxococcales bacterium]|nr:M48 family metalloprotease [Myxococcales bacterium]
MRWDTGEATPLPPKTFKDRVVFVATSAAGTYELRVTPLRDERRAATIIKNLKSSTALAKGAAQVGVGGELFGKVVDGYLKDYLERGLPKSTEFAADRVSIGLVTQIGYLNTGLRSFLTSMAKRRAGAKDKFYDTHPRTGERLQNLDATIAKAGGPSGVAVAARFTQTLSGDQPPTPAAAGTSVPSNTGPPRASATADSSPSTAGAVSKLQTTALGWTNDTDRR